MLTSENFYKIGAAYNQILTIMSAICVSKGAMPMEQYPGRFFAADLLEFLVEYGRKLGSSDPRIAALTARLSGEFDRVRDLTTPTNKPIYEMTLEEFEKVMNI